MIVVLGATGIYLATGLLFAVWFVGFGVGRVDPVARGAGIWFRVLIVPGCAALWPLLLVKWLRARREPGPDLSGAHA